MNRFKIIDLPLAGLKLIERVCLDDERGSFSRLFCARELKAAGWVKPVVQVNHSITYRKGTVRGLHFQYPPYSEMKLVTCTRGKIWDIAVDIRSGSSTFLKWHAEILTAQNRRALLIPEGFAHGFQALSNQVELCYFSSSPYCPKAEGGLNPIDPLLNIRWPLQITILSRKDKRWPFICKNFAGINGFKYTG